MSARVVWSVGHGARTLDGFVELLRGAGIETLVDVRRFPRSRRHPHFDAAALDGALAEAGLRREWLGEELGGFRDGGYEAHVETDDFRRGLARLETLAMDRRTAFCCAERRPEHCHRLEIARVLEGRGWTVHHLVEPGRVHVPETPERQGELF